MKHHIKYCKSGIIHLLLNTTDRWCKHDVSVVQGKCIITEWDGDGENIYIEHEIDIEFAKDKLYYRIQEQEKDQIYVYFIPFDLLEE